MTDFSGKMKANRNPEFHQQPAPPVPPDREDPSKRTTLFLTIDARTKGERLEEDTGSAEVDSLSRQRPLLGKGTCSSKDTLVSTERMTEDRG